jgi:hypothetical protein
MSGTSRLWAGLVSLAALLYCCRGPGTVFGQSEYEPPPPPSIEIIIYITEITNFWKQLYVLDGAGLGPNDAVTIILPHKYENYTNLTVPYIRNKDYVQNVIVFPDDPRFPHGSEFVARNKYSQTSKAQLVWHIDDNTILSNQAVPVVKSNCVDLSKSCIFAVVGRSVTGKLPMDLIVAPTAKFGEGDVYFGADVTGHMLFDVLNRKDATVLGVETMDTLFQSVGYSGLEMQFIHIFPAVSTTVISLSFNESIIGILSVVDVWKLAASYCSANTTVINLIGFDECAWNMKDAIVSHAEWLGRYSCDLVSEATLLYIEMEFLSRNKILGSRGLNVVLSTSQHSRLHFESNAHLVKANDTTSSDWQVITNYYQLVWARSAEACFAADVYSRKRCHLENINTYIVDEAGVDMTIQVSKTLTHLSAATHLGNSSGSYGIVLSDGVYFATDAVSSLDNVFEWLGVTFDILILKNLSDPNIFNSLTGSQSPTNKLRAIPFSLTNRTALTDLLAAGYIVSKSFSHTLRRLALKVCARHNTGYPEHTSWLELELAEYIISHGDVRAYFLNSDGIISHADITDLGNNSAALVQAGNSVVDLSNQFLNATSKLIVAEIEGSIGNQLFVVFTALSVVMRHSMYDYRFILANDMLPTHATNLYGAAFPNKKLLNTSAASTCQADTDDGFDGLFCRYSEQQSRKSSQDGIFDVNEADGDSPKLLVGDMNGNKCRTKGPYRVGDVAESLNYEIVRLKGSFRSFRPFLPFKADVYDIFMRSASTATMDYLQMIIGNINKLAVNMPLVFVSFDGWEGEEGASGNVYRKAEPLQASYLQLAMQAVTRHYRPLLPFFVFLAQDLDAVRHLFGPITNACFLGLDTMPDYFSLTLMAHMDAAIVSTSLFSRWAAFLLESRVATKLSSHTDTPQQSHHHKPFVVAPRLLADAEMVPGIKTSAPRTLLHEAFWGCLYPPSWVII